MNGLDIYLRARTWPLATTMSAFDAMDWQESVRFHREQMSVRYAQAVGHVSYRMDVAAFVQGLAGMVEQGRAFLFYADRRHQLVPSSHNLALLAALCLGSRTQVSGLLRLTLTERLADEDDIRFESARMIRLLAQAWCEGREPDWVKLRQSCLRLRHVREACHTRSAFFHSLEKGDMAASMERFHQWHEDMAAHQQSLITAQGEDWRKLSGRIWLEGLALLRICQTPGEPWPERYALLPDPVRSLVNEENRRANDGSRGFVHDEGARLC